MEDARAFEKAKWHYQHEDYPSDAPETGAYLYGGFFLAWAQRRSLLSEEFLEDFADDLVDCTARRKNPGDIFATVGAVLASDMFSEAGLGFAIHMFESDDADYYQVFEDVLAEGLESPYDVPDSWEAYDTLCPHLDAAFAAFRQR